jgi:hypothetical protein
MLNIVNYIVRIGIIVIGIVLVSGLIAPQNGDTTLYRVMGIIFILFGTYRIVLYRMKSKQYSSFFENEEENNNDNHHNYNINKEVDDEKQ